jgi:hypothetical protein
LPVMKRNGSVVAWIVDDTGFVKKGTRAFGSTIADPLDDWCLETKTLSSPTPTSPEATYQ